MQGGSEAKKLRKQQRRARKMAADKAKHAVHSSSPLRACDAATAEAFHTSATCPPTARSKTADMGDASVTSAADASTVCASVSPIRERLLRGDGIAVKKKKHPDLWSQGGRNGAPTMEI